MKNEKLNIEELREILEPVSSRVEPPGTLSARNIADRAEALEDTGDFRPDRFNYKRAMTAAASLVLVAFLTVAASIITRKPVEKVITKSSVTMNVQSEPEPVSSVPEVVSQAQSVPAKPQETYTNPYAAPDYKAVYTALNRISQKYGYTEVYATSNTGQKSAATSKAAGAAAPGTAAENGYPQTDTDELDGTGGERAANKAADNDLTDEEHGETNAQVEGVAEADILQNDGKHLYYLNRSSGKGNIVQIIKADGTGKLEKLSETEIPLPQENARITEMMLAGDRLVIMMTTYQYRCGMEIALTGDSAASKRAVGAVWADDSYFNSTEQTTAAVYDISDRKNPKLVRTYSQDGRYISSRLIGKNLYLVSSYTPRYLGELKESNVEFYVPKAYDSKGANTTLPAKCISIAPDTETPTYSVVSAFDVSGTTPASVEAVLGGGDIIYSSLKKLFVAFNRWDSDVNKTGIMSFNLSGAKISYCAFGTVEGTIKNQFFMDEYDGNFRIGTNVFTNTRDNRMYILDSSLKIIGSLKNIAPGEDLKSVRFDGKKAYMTTAIQTDPLFALDLSDPANPKILGELKIPGFSEYKHFIDENTIVSIGADGNEFSTYGTKLSMFDVTDPAKMKEIHKITVGTRESYSLARTDHKAFTYIASKKLLCIPVQSSIYEANQYYTRSELHLYSVTKENGFVLKARITGDIPVSEGSDSYLSSLNQTVMNRSTYIGNALFGICDASIVSVDLTSYKKLSELTLAKVSGNPDYDGQTFYSKYPGAPAIISPSAR